ncbi:MAG: hypothetical protein ACTSU5_02615 [Promethearchaeota archaeon]
MLASLLICDAAGTAFYSRDFCERSRNLDPILLSGLIAAIDSVGRNIFDKKVATVYYGEENAFSDDTVGKVIVITKDLFQEQRHINFVFLCTSDCALKGFREVATTLFIELKPLLRGEYPNLKAIREKADAVIDNRFGGLVNFCT